MSIRSSTVNRLFLLLFTSTATTTSSNSAAARPTTSRWPNWGGAKEPGQTARLMERDRNSRGRPVRVISVGVLPVGPGAAAHVQHRVAVAPGADRGQRLGPAEVA